MNILVTGGASGLGESITTVLAAKPEHTVWFTYCKSKEKAEQLEAAFSNCKGIYLDFTSEESLAAFVNQMKELNPEALVNNATTGIIKNHFHKIPVDDFRVSFIHNVLPTIQITQEAIRIFRKKKAGKIVTILSAYLVGKPPLGLAEYASNKAYLLEMSKCWATENASFAITANCISPSMMQTSFTSDVDERIVESMVAAHPLKRLLTTNETANAVKFLVEGSEFINGVNLVLNAASDIG